MIQALGAGYSAKSIIKALSKKYPKVAQYSSTAEAAGFNAPSILKALFKGKKGYSEVDQYLTEHERTLKRDKQQRRNAALGVVGTLGTAGALGVAGYKLLKSAQQTAPASQQATITSQQAAAAPQPPGAPPPGTPPPASPIAATTPAISKNAATQPTAPGLAQPPATPSQGLGTAQQGTTSAQGQGPDMFLGQFEEQHPQLTKFIDNHLKVGFTPEQIYENVKKSKFLSPLIKRMEIGTGTPYLERIKTRANWINTGKQVAPEEFKLPESGKLAAGELVASSDGTVGKIHDSKDTHSLFEVNGKKQQIANDQLQALPKEWENIHVDLSKVPEAERSAPLNFVAPSSDRKSLAVRFWEGKEPTLYLYERKDGLPLDDELLSAIQEETDVPVTNGIEFTGAWGEGAKSRGSAFHHRLKMLAQSGDDEEEDDPRKPYIFRRLPITFEHGFMKAVFGEFKRAKGKFNETFKPKKRK